MTIDGALSQTLTSLDCCIIFLCVALIDFTKIAIATFLPEPSIRYSLSYYKPYQCNAHCFSPLSICNIEFFNFDDRQVQKFKIVQAKLKFCGHISKSLIAKAKVNKVHHKWMKVNKSEWFTKKIPWNIINFCKI